MLHICDCWNLFAVVYITYSKPLHSVCYNMHCMLLMTSLSKPGVRKLYPFSCCQTSKTLTTTNMTPRCRVMIWLIVLQLEGQSLPFPALNHVICSKLHIPVHCTLHACFILHTPDCLCCAMCYILLASSLCTQCCKLDTLECCTLFALLYVTVDCCTQHIAVQYILLTIHSVCCVVCYNTLTAALCRVCCVLHTQD